MNKEKYNQIIGDAYKSYQKEINRRLENWIDIQEGDIYEGTSLDDSGRIWTQEEFINKCKTDSEFSERWGLKIEESELSLRDRYEWSIGKVISYDEKDYEKTLLEVNNDESVIHKLLDKHNIPTKLITITYNGEKIESYE
jgi:hypothetical protein